MADKKIEKNEYGQKIEKLENRLMINYSIAVGVYILWTYMNNMIVGAEESYKVTMILAIISLLCGIVCYVFHKKTNKTKNFGHMFVVMALALVYTKFSLFIYKIFGQNVFASLYNIPLFEKFLFNSANAEKILLVLGIVWVVFITVFTIIQIKKENNKKKSGKK